MFPVTLAIVGAGERGTVYARYALSHPDQARVVGVADPNDFNRNQLAQMHHIPVASVFTDWRRLVDQPRLADAVIIATQDAMHTEPAVALADRGYNILLEKPMAPTESDCQRIVDAVLRNRILFAVCHVLRYTRYTRKLKAILDSGAIGKIVSLQHLEPVGYWHQAHSFVRGNWRNERQSTFMLLSKSCHDLDWIRHIMGTRCEKLASFGNLLHFHKNNQPTGAASRCLDCNVDSQCPYSARKLYLRMIERGQTGWPVNRVTNDLTVAGVTAALRAGPYGRCVYECDNDVVDHQVVSMQFAGGQTATFTMTGFNRMAQRKTRIFGTMGEISGDGSVIERFDFLTDKIERIDAGLSGDGSILTGHGGGDYELMRSFVAAVGNNDPCHILSGPEETLESHQMVFAAERARREGRVVVL